MSDEVQRLLDEAACRRVVMAYGPALDWLNLDAFTALFWPDAAIDYGFFSGAAKDFIPIVMGVERTAARRFHLTGGEVITLESATRARAQSYGVTQAISPVKDGYVFSVFYGRYLDRLEKRDGAWRFSARRYLLHGSFSGPYAEGQTMAGLLKADGLDPSHPWYASH